MCHPHKISFEHETQKICQIVFSIISGTMQDCHIQERQHLIQNFPFRKTDTDCGDNKHRNASKLFFLPLYRNSRQPVLWHTCINPWQLRKWCPHLALSPHLQRKQQGRAGASQSQNVLLLYRKSRKSVHTPASIHGSSEGGLSYLALAMAFKGKKKTSRCIADSVHHTFNANPATHVFRD